MAVKNSLEIPQYTCIIECLDAPGKRSYCEKVVRENWKLGDKQREDYRILGLILSVFWVTLCENLLQVENYDCKEGKGKAVSFSNLSLYICIKRRKKEPQLFFFLCVWAFSTKEQGTKSLIVFFFLLKKQ